MSKEKGPILYSNLQYKMGHYLLDTQYFKYACSQAPAFILWKGPDAGKLKMEKFCPRAAHITMNKKRKNT